MVYQSAGSVQENKAPANTQIVLPQSEYTFNPEGRFLIYLKIGQNDLSTRFTDSFPRMLK